MRWVHTPLGMRVTVALGSLLLWILALTWRFRLKGRQAVDDLRAAGTPIIFLFWHSRILPLAHLHRNEGAVVLISEHGDGELITRLIERRGFRAARGSSTRGGARGLRQLLTALKGGADLAITPDGPRGPRRTLKDGVLVAARLSQAPVVPVGVGTRHGWRLSSWDRFLIPRPFATVEVHYGKPMRISRVQNEDEDERAWLEGVLNTLTDEADPSDPDAGAFSPSGLGPAAGLGTGSSSSDQGDHGDRGDQGAPSR
jgi:lysophospholipid acyltransferase (LPLAT)-like uncharacterized protein